MIYLNGELVEYRHFADGAIDVKIDPGIVLRSGEGEIRWLFDNNEETVVVYYLAKHLRTKGIRDVSLILPYLPNARKDRVTFPNHVFTLKYFADLINSLDFRRVVVLDPHSYVSEALIDRIEAVTPRRLIESVIGEIGTDPLMFYPDEGAMKRYSEMIGREYICGAKRRDKITRQILSYEVEGELTPGRDVLMVDDICASGKTLLYAAKRLKELGAGDIYVFVSHCENQAADSDLLKGDIIKRLYTTDSIFRKTHEKVSIVDTDGLFS